MSSTEVPSTDPTVFAARYRELTKGNRHWLSYHFAEDRITPFGGSLATALAACELRLAGTGDYLVRELSDIRYVSTEDDQNEWLKGYEQLVQKFAEILVVRTVLEANWMPGTNFAIEPSNPVTGARPDLVVDTPDHQWLFEIKCPSFVKHQRQRASLGQQIPVRGPLGAAPGMRTNATLPRDNTLKDFLESADTKFRDFSSRPRTGILVVAWDSHVFEATSALSHDDAGLLSANSWHQENGERVAFDAVEGVIVLNHLETLKLAPQEQPIVRQDPFTIGGKDQLPNVWCPNLGRGDLDWFVSNMFDAAPVSDLVAADYTPKDFVMWLNHKGESN